MQQHMILDCGTRHNHCKAFAGTQVTVRSTVMPMRRHAAHGHTADGDARGRGARALGLASARRTVRCPLRPWLRPERGPWWAGRGCPSRPCVVLVETGIRNLVDQTMDQRHRLREESFHISESRILLLLYISLGGQLYLRLH
jgi:hypothetical protein